MSTSNKEVNISPIEAQTTCFENQSHPIVTQCVVKLQYIEVTPLVEWSSPLLPFSVLKSVFFSSWRSFPLSSVALPASPKLDFWHFTSLFSGCGSSNIPSVNDSCLYSSEVLLKWLSQLLLSLTVMTSGFVCGWVWLAGLSDIPASSALLDESELSSITEPEEAVVSSQDSVK